MTKQELTELYKTNTLRQIAKIVNLSQHRVWILFDYYKIKRRPRGNPYGVPFRNKKKKGYIKLNEKIG